MRIALISRIQSEYTGSIIGVNYKIIQLPTDRVMNNLLRRDSSYNMNRCIKFLLNSQSINIVYSRMSLLAFSSEW